MALPYGVKVHCGEDLAMTLRQIDYQCFCESWENEDIKSHSRWKIPYLRPMSSMTEEELKEFISIHETVLVAGERQSTVIMNLDATDWLKEHCGYKTKWYHKLFWRGKKHF